MVQRWWPLSSSNSQYHLVRRRRGNKSNCGTHGRYRSFLTLRHNHHSNSFREFLFIYLRRKREKKGLLTIICFIISEALQLMEYAPSGRHNSRQQLSSRQPLTPCLKPYPKLFHVRLTPHWGTNSTSTHIFPHMASIPAAMKIREGREAGEAQSFSNTEAGLMKQSRAGAPRTPNCSLHLLPLRAPCSSLSLSHRGTILLGIYKIEELQKALLQANGGRYLLFDERLFRAVG